MEIQNEQRDTLLKGMTYNELIHAQPVLRVGGEYGTN